MTIFIMATPVDGGTALIGNASDVCIHLWGTIPSGYPKYIAKALSAAKVNGVYRDYRLQVLPLDRRPVLLPARDRVSRKPTLEHGHSPDDVVPDDIDYLLDLVDDSTPVPTMA